jgi:hypothetical protein
MFVQANVPPAVLVHVPSAANPRGIRTRSEAPRIARKIDRKRETNLEITKVK